MTEEQEADMLGSALNAIEQAMAKEPYSDGETTECSVCHDLRPESDMKYISDHSMCPRCYDDGDALFNVATRLAKELDDIDSDEHAELVALRKYREATRSSWLSLLDADITFKRWEKPEPWQDTGVVASLNEPASRQLSPKELMTEAIKEQGKDRNPNG